MAIALDPKTPIRFVLSSDRHLDAEDQTVWLIKPLLRSEMIAVMDKFEHIDEGYVDKDNRDDAKKNLVEISELLNTYILGWENFKDVNGKEVKYRTSKNKRDNINLDFIPVPLMSELVEGIFEANRLTDDELKN